jgi:hypothetical protein
MMPARPRQPASEREEAFLAAKKRGIKKAQQEIKDLQVHWMKNCIHDVPLQKPRQLADLIETFIEEVT